MHTVWNPWKDETFPFLLMLSKNGFTNPIILAMYETYGEIHENAGRYPAKKPLAVNGRKLHHYYHL